MMKKGPKKFTACLALTLLVGTSMAIPAFAEENKTVSVKDGITMHQKITPLRYDMCSCGGRLLQVSYKENISGDKSLAVRSCTHGKRGEDNLKEFRYTSGSYCTGSCGYDGRHITLGTEWVCYGR